MALNPFQREIQKLAKKMGLVGDDERRVYATPEYQQLLSKFFGQIDLPAGVREDQVTFRTAGGLEYKDEFGYTHKLERNIDGRSPQLGQVSEISTDRPKVLPLSANPEVKNLMDQLTKRTTETLPEKLPDLDPATLAQLQTIAKATQDQLDQLFERGRGELIAGFYGNGTERSTLANDAAGTLLKEQGLVQSDKLAKDEERKLAVRSGLRNQQIQLRDQDINYLLGLLGQETARAVPSAQLTAEQEKLRENSRQFDLTYLLEQEKIKQAQRNNLLSTLSGIASGALAFIPGVGPALSAATSIFSNATRGRGAAGAPPLGGDGGYG